MVNYLAFRRWFLCMWLRSLHIRINFCSGYKKIGYPCARLVTGQQFSLGVPPMYLSMKRIRNPPINSQLMYLLLPASVVEAYMQPACKSPVNRISPPHANLQLMYLLLHASVLEANKRTACKSPANVLTAPCVCYRVEVPTRLQIPS